MRNGGRRQIAVTITSFETSFRRLCNGPPAHVLGCVRAAAIERFNMIDEVAGAAALYRSSGRAGVVRTESSDGPWITRDTAAQVAYAIDASGDVVVARRRKFRGDHDLGVQNGTERDRERSVSEQEQVFRRHRRQSMHVGRRYFAPTFLAAGAACGSVRASN